MKKVITTWAIVLIVCMASAVFFTACNIELKPMDGNEYYTSTEKERSVELVNEFFEETLKNNAECSYCRSFIYENAAYLYLPEMKMLFAQIKKCAQTGEVYNRETLTDEQARIRARYFATPLAEMQKDHGTFAENLQKASAAVSALPL